MENYTQYKKDQASLITKEAQLKYQQQKLTEINNPFDAEYSNIANSVVELQHTIKHLSEKITDNYNFVGNDFRK